MSDVHRYKVISMISESGRTIWYDPHGPDVVLADAYDYETKRLRDLLVEMTLYRNNAAKKITRLRDEITGVEKERDTLRTQLAACRTELLDIRQSCELSQLRDARIDAALSASADLVEYDHNPGSGNAASRQLEGIRQGCMYPKKHPERCGCKPE